MFLNLCVAALTGYALTRMPGWDHTPLWAFAAIPLGVVAANVLEYVLHRYPMHRRMRGMKRMFTQHTVLHHRFFTHAQMEAQERRDYFFVLFPVEFGLLCLVMVATFYALGVYLLGPAFAGILGMTLLGYVIALDVVHLICHLPKRYFERGILSLAPFVYLMELHQLHHNPRRMREVNFNITFPLVDWWMGTLDDGRAPKVSAVKAKEGVR